MGIISCPNCQGKLRVPDDAGARKVKCPSCEHVFTANAGPDSRGPKSGGPKSNGPKSNGPKSGSTPRKSADFEVIDDDRPAKSKRGGDLDSVLDSAGSKSRRRVEDDEDERPRSRRRDDDDDDDRPRSRRRRDDDDDFDDDRPRSRRRRDDDDDFDDDDRPRSRRSRGRAAGGPGGRANWHHARQGLMLNFLAQWCMVGAIGLMMLFMLILWAGEFLNFITYFAGMAGMAYWGLTAVGVCYLFALGPTRGAAFGLGIATACVTLVHVALVLVQFTGSGGGISGLGLGMRGLRGGGGLHWEAMITQLPHVPGMITDLIQNGGRGWGSISALTALLELVRLVLFMFFLRAVADEMRDSSAAKSATAVAIVVPAGLLVFGLINLIMNEMAGRMDPNIGMVIVLAFLGAFIGMFIFVSMAVKAGQDAIDRRM